MKRPRLWEKRRVERKKRLALLKQDPPLTPEEELEDDRGFAMDATMRYHNWKWGVPL